jgi:peptide/nickel transport system substrate-binding protein
VTSADVVYSMESILAPNHGRFQTAFRVIESITAPDDATVVIRLQRPYAPLISLLTVFDAPVLPKHVFEGTDPLTNPANQAPIGSGPFRFVEWVRGERVVLERFDGYFLEPALLDRLIYRIVPQDVARSVALEVGEADLVWGFYMPTSDLDRLEANPAVQVWKGLAIPSLYFMFMNTANPALADVRVRQALMHAIDREQIVEQAQGGLGQVASGPFGAGFGYAYDAGADYRTLYPYDPERARALLAEAGVSDLTLDFVYDSARGSFAAAAEIMRDNLRQVGITLNVQPVERSVMVERVYGRNYDLSMQSFTSSGDPAIGYHRIYLAAEPGTNFVNATGYAQPRRRPAPAARPPVSPTAPPAPPSTRRRWRSSPRRPDDGAVRRALDRGAAANLRGMRVRLDQRDGLEFLWLAGDADLPRKRR